MATFAAAHAELCRLRRDIARIEGRLADDDRLAETLPSPAPFPAKSLQRNGMRRKSGGPARSASPLSMRVLGGGLPLAALHEIRAGESRDGGVGSGFALALLARLGGGRGALLDRLDRRGRSSRARRARSMRRVLLALGLDPARIVEVAVRTREGGALGFRGGALLSRPRRGGLRAAECFARSLRHAPLRAPRPRERASPAFSFASERMGRAERGGAPLPRRAGAGRRDRRFRRRRRPHGLAADAGEEPLRADRRLHGGVECP